MHTDGSRKRTGGTNRSHVEDVHNTGSCTRHETRTRRKHNHIPPTHASPSHPYPSRNTPNKQSQDVHWPPAKIATPASGSDVAARLPRAWLRAALLQVPALTSKMSTTLKAAQGMRHAHVTTTSTSPHHNSRIPLAPILQHLKQKSQDVLLPPAKIATPASGSDVAARLYRNWLRAAVLQAPDVTLKMSTALDV